MYLTQLPLPIGCFINDSLRGIFRIRYKQGYTHQVGLSVNDSE